MRRNVGIVASLLVSLAALAGIFCKKSPAPVPVKIIADSLMYSSSQAKTPANGPLKIALVREGPLAVGTLSDGRVYASGNTTFALATDDGGFEHDARWLSGLPAYDAFAPFEPRPFVLGGRFPEDAWFVEAVTQKRANSDFVIAHWIGSAWKELPSDAAPLHRSYVALGPWKKDCTLALRLHSFRGSDVDGAAHALLATASPRFEIVGGAKSSDAVPIFAKGAMPTTFASLASGEVVATTSFDEQGVSVQRWTAAGGDGVVEQLPDKPSLWDPIVTMSSNASAWIGGNVKGEWPYLVHFDGESWSKVDAPTASRILSMAEAPDATLWIVTAATTTEKYGAVWRRPKGLSSFERIEVPRARFPERGKDRLVLSAEGVNPQWKTAKGDTHEAERDWWLEPRSVAVSASGELFVVAVAVVGEGLDRIDEKQSFYSVVLRPRAASTPFVLSSPFFAAVEIQNLAPPEVTVDANDTSLFKSDCPSLFLRVGDIPEDAPADFDPKELRKALKTIKPPTPDPLSTNETPSVLAMEVRLMGKRAVGVYMPACYSDDCHREVARFVSALATKLPKVSQTLYCLVPIAIRDLGATFAP